LRFPAIMHDTEVSMYDNNRHTALSNSAGLLQEYDEWLIIHAIIGSGWADMSLQLLISDGGWGLAARRGKGERVLCSITCSGTRPSRAGESLAPARARCSF
jgi:hypothetical protein